MKIEIKNRWTGAILFELEKENNTIKETLQEAVKSYANLSNAYLRGADLSYADLSYAYLRGADLSDANLSYADLSYANLSDAYLRGADLSYADLSNAYLRGADLSDANLSYADLSNAYLRGADLSDAYLSDADLSYANLRGADLSGANLRGADLSDAKEIPYLPFACPSDGTFIGWKKVRNCLVRLEIPEDAKRCSATTNKCRCDKALVKEIVNLASNESVDKIVNDHYCETIYEVGKMVYPDSFDEDRWNECSNGIHFFINKEEAINYN